METTIATSSALLKSYAPIDSFGMNVFIFLAFIGGAVVTFVFLVGVWNLLGRPLPGRYKFKKKVK